MEDLIFATLATPTALQASPCHLRDGFLLVPTGGNLLLSTCSTGNVVRLWPFQISESHSLNNVANLSFVTASQSDRFLFRNLFVLPSMAILAVLSVTGNCL